MRGAFGGHFSWQAHYLVTLDDVLKCPRVSFFETVVIFHAHHFQARDFSNMPRRTWQNSNMCSCNRRVTLCISDCPRCGAVPILTLLAQPSRRFVKIALLVARC